VSIERVITSGAFPLHGGTWEVDNNIWLVGDHSEVLVIDAVHAIAEAVGDRRVVAVVLETDHLGRLEEERPA
jgi:hypothetical protein